MNTKELIKKYEELLKEHSPFHEPVPYTSMVELFLKDLKQLDEPPKVTIPQYVADWLKENDWREETLGEQSVFDVFDNLKNDSKNSYYENVKPWIDANGDLFACAWLDGYEVETEKRYLVKMKGIKDPNSYLKYNKNTGHWYFGSLHIYVNDVDTKIYHTKKQLEEANFGWVFDCPGVEVEEVEK